MATARKKAVWQRVEFGGSIGVVTVGLALLALPRTTPIVGGTPTWVGALVLLVGVLAFAVWLAAFIVRLGFRWRSPVIRVADGESTPQTSSVTGASQHGAASQAGLAAELAGQRRVVREHYAELEKILGPRPMSTGSGVASPTDEDSAARSLIRKVVSGAFQNLAISEVELDILADILDGYRARPWTPDPAIGVEVIGAPSPLDVQQKWVMKIGGTAYQIQADGRKGTLDTLGQVLLADLIPKVKTWDKWLDAVEISDRQAPAPTG